MQAERNAASIGRGVLQAIFAVFLGLMITAVVGVGVYTFLPNPAEQTQQQIADLQEQRDEVQGCSTSAGCKPTSELTDAQAAELAALDERQKNLQERADQQQQAWAQRSSIVLIVIATGLMIVSLVLGEALTVLSNGILLGGLFTMLYGVGWGIASGNSVTRFLVLVVALALSLLLGYLKFARHRDSRPPAPIAKATAVASAGADQAGTPPKGGGASVATLGEVAAALAALTARIADLEWRTAAAGALLGGASEQPESPRPSDG